MREYVFLVESDGWPIAYRSSDPEPRRRSAVYAVLALLRGTR